MLELEQSLWGKGVSRVAGIDEAGRGALAGPVVAAAVILPESNLLIRGLNDSKKLSPAERDRLFAVVSSAASAVGVGKASAEDIDRYNIRQANLKAMRAAVDALAREPEHLLIDGIDRISWNGPQDAVVKGDSKSLSVAAASIVAKVTRDRIMIAYDATYPEYGFVRHKGYGTPEHVEAIRLHGRCPLHRVSFRLKNEPAIT
ncbi:MAG: ribonuclease HII [Candidatus Latescibacteria bacterium]|nr:ribonuclease HII [Candidatus Latescibacterota bacterium]